MEEVHRSLLEMLDAAYAKLREIHADIEYWNDSTNNYKDALGQFAQVQKDIFAFKEIQYTLEGWRAGQG